MAALQAAVDLAVAHTREACQAADNEALTAMQAEGISVSEITEHFRTDCIAAVADVKAQYGAAANEELYQELADFLGK